ncbi:MAG: DUF167 domain-containing protein [Candidatus Woesearchaeota archaeon]
MLKTVKVKPSAKHSMVIAGDIIKVEVKSPAAKGKANKELVKLLSKHFKKKVTILKGHKSKQKVVQIESI